MFNYSNVNYSFIMEIFELLCNKVESEILHDLWQDKILFPYLFSHCFYYYFTAISRKSSIRPLT